MKRVIRAVLLAGVTISPETAMAADPSNPWCCGAKLTRTFGDAAIEIQGLTTGLFAVALAAPVLWGLARQRLRQGRESVGLLAFLAAWRAGSLPLALAGIAYLAMNVFVAVYAYPAAASYRTYAPGWAEMAMVLWAGLLACASCTLAHAHLKARGAG